MANILNISASYFSHNSSPVRQVWLRESDWPEVTQAAFMPKERPELTVSWFLS